MYGDKLFIKKIAELKGYLSKISDDIQKLKGNKKEIEKNLSERLDQFAAYHNELGSFLNAIMSMNTRINKFGKQLDTLKRRTRWYLLLNVILLLINILFLTVITSL